MVEIKFNDGALYKDLQKFSDIAGESVAEQGQQIINKFAKQCMQQYYDEYEPELYHRTDQMLNRSYKKYKEGSGKNAKGGVKISSAFTSHPGVPHCTKTGTWTEETIYEEVWDLGYHGKHLVPLYMGDSLSADRRWGLAYIGNGINYFNQLEGMAYSDDVKDNVMSKALKEACSASYSVISFG